jgi:hypothetical protein
MTNNYLLLARHMLIAWVSLSLMPIEYFHDMIEEELVRRGVNPNV